MLCDIIIPVYNNARQLPLVLPALMKQKIPAAWQIQIILVDDGSTDKSAAVARSRCQASPWPFQIITTPHAGAAGARNQATSRSQADIVLLLGADIILRPNALLTHLNFHFRHPDPRCAGLGFVLWDPLLSPTPFMEWMIHGGSQNSFDDLLGQIVADPRHYFYGSHLSIKRAVLPSPPFPNSYPGYGWEDLDLGRRLANQTDLQLHVLPQAIGHHHHYYSAKQIFHRQQLIGRGFRVFHARHPAVAAPHIESYFHRLKYQIIYFTGLLFALSQITDFFSSRLSTPTLYKLAINSHFWYGFHRTYPQK